MKKALDHIQRFFPWSIPNARAHGNFSRNEGLELLCKNYTSHRARDK